MGSLPSKRVRQHSRQLPPKFEEERPGAHRTKMGSSSVRQHSSASQTNFEYDRSAMNPGFTPQLEPVNMQVDDRWVRTSLQASGPMFTELVHKSVYNTGKEISLSTQQPATPKPAKTVHERKLDKPWRNFKWDQKPELKKELEEFTPSDPAVTKIKILVAGQVGAGKSSFINSVNNAFQGRITSGALVDSSAGNSKSFTKTLRDIQIRSKKNLPIVFRDIMGLEPEILAGTQTDDIINALCGHVKEGYRFNESKPIAYKDQHYTGDPSLSDQAFCLVYVIAADTVQFTDDKLIDKLKIIRQRISDEGIPQVIIMTKVDEACPLVKNDLRKIYYSKKIKEKMQMCSDKVGVPMCNIFPVKNYHDEIDTDDDVDALILKALDQVVHLADSRLLSRS